MDMHEPKDDLFIPNEIAEIIISNVPHGSGLFNLSLVCKAYNDMAWPHLFRTLRLRAEPMSDNEFSSINWYEPPPNLASENLGRPVKGLFDICKYVQCLDLNIQEVRWYEQIKGHVKLLSFLPYLKELSLHPPPKQMTTLKTGQLEILRLNFPDDIERFWFPKEVFDTTSFDLNQYLSLPALRTLQFENIQNSFRFGMVSSGKPRSSTVVDLRFINLHLQHVNILADVLPSIRQLERFMLEVNGMWISHMRQGLAPHDFGALLQPHSESLEELVIAYGDNVFDPVRHSPLPVIGLFHNYHALTRLAIAESFLVTSPGQHFFHMLPPNLQEFQVQHPRDLSPGMVGHVDNAHILRNRLTGMEFLSRYKEEVLPRLKHVVSWFQRPPGTQVYRFNLAQASNVLPEDPISGFEKHVAELAEKFRKVNVKFEVILTSSFRNTPFEKYLYI